MAAISKVITFATGDQVTASKLNNLVDNSTFTSGAVDNTSTQLSGGAIIVKDGGVTTAKINNGGVTTAKIADSNVTTAKILDANVTKAKIENLSDYTVLGNVSGGAAAPAEVSILDEDDMASDSNTAIATQQSIKAYVDEYALKYSGAMGTFNSTTSFQDLDLSSIVGVNRSLVVMEVYNSSSQTSLLFKQKSSSIEPVGASSFAGYGASGLETSTLNKGGSIVVVTDSAGVIEYKAGSAHSGINYKILCYQKLA